MTQQSTCGLVCFFTPNERNLSSLENWNSNVHKQPNLPQVQTGDKSIALQCVNGYTKRSAPRDAWLLSNEKNRLLIHAGAGMNPRHWLSEGSQSQSQKCSRGGQIRACQGLWVEGGSHHKGIP